MIPIIICLVSFFSVPVDYYYEPKKEKEIPMSVNRADKRSKNFSEKVKEWNLSHGVFI